MSTIKSIRFKQVSRPLKTVFSTSLGQKKQVNSLLINVMLANGISTLGEAPTSIAFHQETIGAMTAVVQHAARWLKGADVCDWVSLSADLRKKYFHARAAVSGLEVALFRAFLVDRGLSEYRYWGAEQPLIETDITIPLFSELKTLERWVISSIAKGFRIFKLKVGTDRKRDEELLMTVWQLLHEKTFDFHLRLDGNQGFSRKSFLEYVRFIDGIGVTLDLFEQPLPVGDWKGYEKLHKKWPIPIILDESVLCYDDAKRAIENDLCDGINVKIAKCGISESVRIIEATKNAGKKLMIGCMMETMIGLSAAINLSAGMGVFDYIDLDAVHFMYGENYYSGISIDGPAFRILEQGF
jgi:L-Ala-D/L-Glu epimerase